jgi:hypothetical protein
MGKSFKRGLQQMIDLLAHMRRFSTVQFNRHFLPKCEKLKKLEHSE